jgi:hypothetical protein
LKIKAVFWKNAERRIELEIKISSWENKSWRRVFQLGVITHNQQSKSVLLEVQRAL